MRTANIHIRSHAEATKEMQARFVATAKCMASQSEQVVDVNKTSGGVQSNGEAKKLKGPGAGPGALYCCYAHGEMGLRMRR